MNILYIGSSGAFSLLPFKNLLASSYPVSAVGIYRPVEFKNKIIAIENESLALAADQHEIPRIDLSQPVEQILAQCKKFAIDLILMSCYSKRLPKKIIEFPAYGCFNMHPALLPSHRGPEPIFWQMKSGGDVGVSWHRVNEDFDEGDIIAQQKVYLDDAASYGEINHTLVQAGVELMRTMLSDIAADKLISTVQRSALANYQSYPVACDFVVDVAWSAQHAYNFMCATQTFGYPFLCQLGETRYLLDTAIDYCNNDSLQAVEVQGNRLYIPCYVGVLIATFTARI